VGGLTVLISLAALASIGLAEWGWRHQPSMAFYLIPTRSWELLIGALVALREKSRGEGPYVGRGANLLALAGLGMIVLSVIGFDGRVPVPSLYTLIPTAGTALVLIFGREGTGVARVLGVPALVGLGLMSYSLYLWHQPLFAFARIFSISRSETAVYLALMLVSVILAYLSFTYVEKPFRNRGFLSRRAVFGSAATVSAGFIAIGAVIHHEEGFQSRFGERYVEESRLIAELNRDRMGKIGMRVCHFWPDDQDVDAFIAQWDCVPGSEEPRILVVGDSHAADMAMALRLNGWRVGQLTGAGCSLDESSMGHRCRKFFSTVLGRLEFAGVDAILLAKRWEETDIERAGEILGYWRRFEVPLILAGPMPEYPKFEVRMPLRVSRWGSRAAAGRRYPFDELRYESVSAGIEEAAGRAAIPYVDTKSLFCSLTIAPSCSPVLGDVYLLADRSHLSVRGAELFGERLAGRIRDISAQATSGRPEPPGE
jgi:hypothetical protein